MLHSHGDPKQLESPVPVTARLSKHFYERLGEQVANELVDWFNAVDSTYKAELRQLNELNFARFDAKVEQRFSQFEAMLERRLGEQTRWMFVAWASLMVAIIGFGLR